MDDITYNDNRERILQRRSGEHEQIGKTDYHTRNRVGHKCNAVQYLLELCADRASRCHKSSSIGDQRSRKGCNHGYHNRIDIYSVQLPVFKYCLDMFHCKVHSVRPFLNERRYKHDDEHTQ